ncbi:HNH endonuclease [Amycolatopsis rhabdoformis]|uniref:HNH endonuclease n=1 Tax=Amycolatopsis rhabdoformis TaxID=1448059 RepID=A0ABZ1I3M8_9PSEU|nr:HNH endonuclease [Amycolatopsis rhabdoformis]WSE29002.1 HNH endonuclease [Amycolatopsis rhabdoformis]
MIELRRVALPAVVASELSRLTSRIPPGDNKTARRLWTSARGARRSIRAALASMASGRGYCMYCGDGLGSTVDHFEPVARAPHRAFDWLNHLLACEYCNSHHKRDRFPLDAAGRPLLIDPTAEDPLDHLFLVLSIGTYRALTDKGRATIEVCGLNRPLLERGRAAAVDQVAALVTHWWLGTPPVRRRAIWTLRDQPHADVLHAMLRQSQLPGAPRIFTDPALLDLLRNPDLRAELLA